MDSKIPELLCLLCEFVVEDNSWPNLMQFLNSKGLEPLDIFSRINAAEGISGHELAVEAEECEA